MVNSYSDSAKNFPLRGVVRNADSSFPLRGEWRVAPREDLYFLITQESGRYEIYGEGFLL